MRFAGLRSLGAFSVAAMLPALAGLTAYLLLENFTERPDPWTGLEERARAGRLALDAFTALDRRSARAEAALAEAETTALRSRLEATALTVSLLGGAAAEPITAVAWIDPAADRITRALSSEPVRGSTASAALPHLTAALRDRAPVVIVEAGASLWAIGPQTQDGERLVLRAALPAARPAVERDAAKSALVTVAAPVERPPLIDGKLTAPALGAAGLSFLLAALWLRVRWQKPLENSLETARRWAHGADDARADATKGGRDARELARTLNTLIDASAQRSARRNEELEQGIRALAAELRALGRGDLAARSLPSPEVLAPLTIALEEARHDLSERLGTIHRVAAEICLASAAVGQGLKRLTRGGAEAAEAITRAGKDASTAQEEVRHSASGLSRALDELATAMAGYRRLSLQLRAELSVGVKRAADLQSLGESILSRVSEADAIDRALDLLAAIGASNESVPARGVQGAAIPGAQLLTAVKRARAEIEVFRREMSGIGEQLAEIGDALASVSTGTPAAAPELEPAIGSLLHAAVSAQSRAAERSTDALRAMERAAKLVESSSVQIAANVEQAARLGPELALGLAPIDLGAVADRELRERLDRAKAALDEGGAEALTEDARGLVDEVLRAAEDARARLSRLIAVTEAATEVIREPRRV